MLPQLDVVGPRRFYCRQTPTWRRKRSTHESRGDNLGAGKLLKRLSTRNHTYQPSSHASSAFALEELHPGTGIPANASESSEEGVGSGALPMPLLRAFVM